MWEKSGRFPQLSPGTTLGESWEGFLENGTTGVVFLNGGGQITYANSEAERLFSQGEWLVRAPAGIAASTSQGTELLRDAVGAALKAIGRRALPEPRELLIRSKQGGEPPLRVFVQPLLSNSGAVPSFVRSARVMLCLNRLVVPGAIDYRSG